VLSAFLWGCFAAGSLLLGALVVAVHPLKPRTVGIVMAFGAGVLLSAVSFELVEKAVITEDGLGGATLGLFTGAAVFTVGDLLITRYAGGAVETPNPEDVGTEKASGLAIALGALLDGIPETAVLGLTILETGEVGWAVLVAVFISNLPEGIAATASLRESGWSWARLYLMWAGITLICALASAAGYALLDGASTWTLAFMFAFAGGAILGVLVTTMMPQAHALARRSVGMVTTFGFFIAFALNWFQG
jgi:ZIP family zinc transporter